MNSSAVEMVHKGSDSGDVIEVSVCESDSHRREAEYFQLTNDLSLIPAGIDDETCAIAVFLGSVDITVGLQSTYYDLLYHGRVT
jgi:hypothetical protein